MNGKGSAPRNCFSQQFKANYERIRWRPKNARRRERRDWKLPDNGH